jgi:hypothetical protein
LSIKILDIYGWDKAELASVTTPAPCGSKLAKKFVLTNHFGIRGADPAMNLQFQIVLNQDKPHSLLHC